MAVSEIRRRGRLQERPAAPIPQWKRIGSHQRAFDHCGLSTSWRQPADFAAAAGLSLESLGLIEMGGGAFVQSEPESLRRGLAHFGVVIVEEGDGFGAGVRLKFTRQDVRQILRLEGEGGNVVPTTPPSLPFARYRR